MCKYLFMYTYLFILFIFRFLFYFSRLLPEFKLMMVCAPKSTLHNQTKSGSTLYPATNYSDTKIRVQGAYKRYTLHTHTHIGNLNK